MNGWPVTAAQTLVVIAAVFASVYHAEVVAHRLGEPFGTLVLALAVTVIEVALIVSVMLGGGASAATLARDTVFATAMITLNGLVAMYLPLGAARHYEQGFQVLGASSALAVLAALVTLTLVLPNFTSGAAGPVFTTAQFVFAGIVSLVLYCVFVFVQTVGHRDYFLPNSDGNEEAHVPPPSNGPALLSSGLLLASLVVVMGLACFLFLAVVP